MLGSCEPRTGHSSLAFRKDVHFLCKVRRPPVSPWEKQRPLGWQSFHTPTALLWHLILALPFTSEQYIILVYKPASFSLKNCKESHCCNKKKCSQNLGDWRHARHSGILETLQFAQISKHFLFVSFDISFEQLKRSFIWTKMKLRLMFYYPIRQDQITTVKDSSKVKALMQKPSGAAATFISIKAQNVLAIKNSSFVTKVLKHVGASYLVNLLLIFLRSCLKVRRITIHVHTHT